LTRFFSSLGARMMHRARRRVGMVSTFVSSRENPRTP
jgi:hypothetical protein